MAKEYSRTERVAELIRRELAQLIQQEIKDPRMPKFVTVSAVKVSRDFSYAKVYITALGDDSEINSAVSVLNSAAGFLNKAVSRGMRLRKMPELQFVYDSSIEYANRISKLIDDAVSNDESPEHKESES